MSYFSLGFCRVVVVLLLCWPSDEGLIIRYISTYDNLAKKAF